MRSSMRFVPWPDPVLWRSQTWAPSFSPEYSVGTLLDELLHALEREAEGSSSPALERSISSRGKSLRSDPVFPVRDSGVGFKCSPPVVAACFQIFRLGTLPALVKAVFFADERVTVASQAGKTSYPWFIILPRQATGFDRSFL